jgi:hypothetical protein
MRDNRSRHEWEMLFDIVNRRCEHHMVPAEVSTTPAEPEHSRAHARECQRRAPGGRTSKRAETCGAARRRYINQQVYESKLLDHLAEKSSIIL